MIAALLLPAPRTTYAQEPQASGDASYMLALSEVALELNGQLSITSTSTPYIGGTVYPNRTPVMRSV